MVKDDQLPAANANIGPGADRNDPGAAYSAALGDLLRFRPSLEASLDALIARHPDFAPAALARAYLGVLTSEPRPSREALAVLTAMEREVPHQKLSPAEQQHLRVIEAWAAGHFGQAQKALDALVATDPNDVLALFAGHQLDFFLGDCVSLRDRIGRVLPDWDPRDPVYGFLLGMFAFGLEECGWYDRAESVGTKALEFHPEDVWALHAVVHTHEMRGQVALGLALMDQLAPHWTEGNFLNVHNFWHRALYLLELGDQDSVLSIYDRHLHNHSSAGVALEMLDAASLLWRLFLDGREETERFNALASAWEKWGEDGGGRSGDTSNESFYVFNDCHAVMALVGAGRYEEAERWVRELRRYADTADDGLTNVEMTRAVGLPVAEALLAFGAGRHDEVVDLLLPIREGLARFGGSHAQRDAFQRTLLESSLRSGNYALARWLVNERISLKEDSPYNWQARKSVADAAGDPAAAHMADARVASLRGGWRRNYAG